MSLSIIFLYFFKKGFIGYFDIPSLTTHPIFRYSVSFDNLIPSTPYYST